MYSQEFANKTEYYKKRIGDSVLLAKCYDLSGRDADAKRVAAQVARTELQTLSEIPTTINDISILAEQILRVIYVFYLSGKLSEASIYFKTFLRKAKEAKSTGKDIAFDVSFRICIGQIILGEHEQSLEELLDKEVFLARLASSWRAKNIEELETCYQELEREIETAENVSGLVPWSDTWHYILLNRLEKFLKGDAVI